MKKKGLLVIVSGPSGAGKGTVLSRVMSSYENLKVAVSATTRKPREGEIDGVNYYFKSKEEFKRLIDEDAFLEYECNYGNYYGTLKSEVVSKIEQGKDVVLEIDVKGAMNIKNNKYQDAVTVFVCPTSMEVLLERLKGRGTETPEALKIRTDSALDEIKQADKYEFVVVNDDLSECADDIIAIIKSQKCTSKINKDFIQNIINGGK
jgi:guanylate kinase